MRNRNIRENDNKKLYLSTVENLIPSKMDLWKIIIKDTNLSFPDWKNIRSFPASAIFKLYLKIINAPKTPADQRTPRTVISLREPGEDFITRTRCKQRHHSLFANSSFPTPLSSSLSGTITPSVFRSTNMACRWLNVPRPTSWPEIRISIPRSIDEPNASAWMHNPNEWTTATEVRTVPYLCSGEIDTFTRLNALQPILDVPLQLRVELLRPFKIQHYPFGYQLSKK